MNDKTLKNIRVCCYIALAVCGIWAVLAANNFIGILTGNTILPRVVNWSHRGTMKIVYFALYVLSTLSQILLICFAVVNVLKGIRDNMVFPKSNVKLLFWLALVDFVYELCWTNLPILFDDRFVLQLVNTNFITPFFLLFFAFMYKVAADAVEENNLTV